MEEGAAGRKALDRRAEPLTGQRRTGRWRRGSGGECTMVTPPPPGQRDRGTGRTGPDRVGNADPRIRSEDGGGRGQTTSEHTPPACRIAQPREPPEIPAPLVHRPSSRSPR